VDAMGGKAAVLGELRDAGFAVPAGFVVTDAGPGLDADLAAAARRLGGDRFAVRSSAVAEDLPDASYAGLYETYLDVPAAGLGEAVRRCFAAAGAERVTAYRKGHHDGGMAVLVQVMVDAVAAGVAFTAHPVTGDRGHTVVTAVAGVGEPLVSGQETGEEWTATTGAATLTRPAARPVLTADQATQVAALAGRVAERYGRPQDVEWAFDRASRLWLLQARPMTALPEPVAWEPPGPGLWMRNFRLGEWLPEAVTPLFATWLLPAIEAGYLDGMRESIGIRVPFRWALVNGWYYNATPIPTPALLFHVLRRAGRTLYHALIGAGRDPAAADRAVLSGLARQWREEQAPRYRRLVAAAEAEVATAPPDRLVALVDALGREAGISLWYLAIVGGSAWKMEARLTRFAREHLAEALPDGPQVLLRGLPGAEPVFAPHAVHSVDWVHPVAGDLPTPTAGVHGVDRVHAVAGADRQAALATQRADAERQCRAALAGRPALLRRYERLIDTVRRYTVLREQQAAQFTLAWPVLRAGVQRLGPDEDVFFYVRSELDAPPPAQTVAERRDTWQRQRRLAAPLTLGRPPRLVGDVIDRAVRQARGPVDTDGLMVGHPASAGRATGPVRVLTDPAEFGTFGAGDVLVAKATTPAWTPLFARAAAIITDGGTLAAHASLVAREYGIPAVVGTGDATHRLRTGQRVTVDGTAGTVTVH
jgi:rifampicin phosphotransferase